MINLRGVGFFRELTGGGHDAASVIARRQDEPTANEQEIVRYLSKSPLLLFAPGVAADAFAPGTEVGPLGIRTDGVWSWPAELAYYVERYHLRLDSEFVTHMESRYWRVPSPESVPLDSITAFDGIPDDGASAFRDSARGSSS